MSTIQRRTTLQSIPQLKHTYSLDPICFGLRPVEFWVKVERGKAEEVAKHIFEKYNKNVLRASIQIDSISNVGVSAYVNSSKQLYSMLEE